MKKYTVEDLEKDVEYYYRLVDSKEECRSIILGLIEMGKWKSKGKVIPNKEVKRLITLKNL